VSRCRITNPKKLRKMSAAIGKPVKWATTNGTLGRTVLAIASDGEEYRIDGGQPTPTGHTWTPHDDGHWSRSQ
jgi:hypothetical protein